MKSFLTPPELAEHLGVKASKVITWIKNGELEALNVATDPGGRPRFRISREAVKKFEQRRATQPLPKPPKKYRRRKNTDGGFVEYIT